MQVEVSMLMMILGFTFAYLFLSTFYLSFINKSNFGLANELSLDGTSSSHKYEWRGRTWVQNLLSVLKLPIKKIVYWTRTETAPR